MDEKAQGICEDEGSCVTIHGQQREEPARDEQPLPVTADSSAQFLPKPFVEVGCVRVCPRKAHINICIYLFRSKATNTSMIW